MSFKNKDIEEIKELKKIFSDPYALQYSKRFWETFSQNKDDNY